MSEASLEELYVAYFGRAADPAGLGYWLIEEDLGTPDTTIALQFVPQAETLSLYPLLDNPALLATSSSARDRKRLSSADVFERLYPSTRSMVGASPCSGRMTTDGGSISRT